MLYDRILKNIENRRNNILSGKINCIPFGLPRFEEMCPGIEKKTLTYITASTKVGKSKYTDYFFVYKTLFYAMKHPEQLRIKIFYFTWEMSIEEKYLEFISYLLYILSNRKTRISPKDLTSTKASKPLPQEILDILNTDIYKRIFKFFEEHVVFIDTIRNPYGIYKFCQDYAKNNGTQYTKKLEIKNKQNDTIETREVDDYYEPNDPDEYRLIIVDHMALLTPENGSSLRDSMVELSSRYFVTLRNKYHYTIIGIVQQAMAQESNENFRLGKLKPTVDGIGEAKVIARDCNMMLGLYSPFRHGIREYEGYDITKFRDNIRFMEIMINRSGGSGIICPLFFDGATNYFEELPLPDDPKLVTSYNIIARINNPNILLFIHKQRTKNESNISTRKIWLWKDIQHWLCARIKSHRIRS
jgi:hypothetical protein